MPSAEPFLQPVDSRRPVSTLSFDASSRRLGAVGTDGIVRLREIPSGHLLWTREESNDRIRRILDPGGSLHLLHGRSERRHQPCGQHLRNWWSKSDPQKKVSAGRVAG